ncbi:acyltransferase domain-containing protein [Streptomyces sp. NPDC050560]|uniref:acyltransferase domain-containing protein n=1 Tax=Streptomyces sp. NPDC050560 TaxID=3365630 RepID=UPI00378C95F6
MPDHTPAHRPPPPPRPPRPSPPVAPAPEGPGPDRPLALLLPGQGAQHPGMAVALYGRDEVFTDRMDAFFALLGPAQGAAMRADWLAGPDRPAALLDGPLRAQPLLFAVEFALGSSLLLRGVRPAALLGHSVGELAAAALAGVFDLPTAARFMAARSDALAALPDGGMLAVAAAPAELAPYLGPPGRDDGVVVGGVNAPRQTLLAGPEPALSALGARLVAAGLVCRPVPAGRPYHAPAAVPAALRALRALPASRLRAPRIPIRSTRTGRWVTDTEARDPGFWAYQLARPVLFWPALDGLLAGGAHTLAEVGPGQQLSVLARRHPAVRSGHSGVFAALPPGAAGTPEHWRDALARLGAADAVPAGTAASAPTYRRAGR